MKSSTRKSFWNLKPVKFEGADSEELKKLSTLIDETLYGEKDGMTNSKNKFQNL